MAEAQSSVASDCTSFLVLIGYYELEPVDLWRRGLVEDCESSTPLRIRASSEAVALSWSREVARALRMIVDPSQVLDPVEFPFDCWVVPDDDEMQHLHGFIQTVDAGTMPNLQGLTTPAYRNWVSRSP